MINNWLKKDERYTDNPKLFIFDLTEDNSVDINDLKEFLANQVLIHLTNPSKLIRVFNDKPTVDLKNHILNLKLPPENANYSPRQSIWAEIVSAEILEKMNDCFLPVYKLRFKESPDKSMRGKADVVACKILDDMPTIVFSEVKSKTVYVSPKKSKELAIEAFTGLSSNNVDFPEMIEYMSERIEELPNDAPNKYEMRDIFDNAIVNPNSYSRDFHIFFVFEKERWKEECLEVFDNEKINELPNLTINIVLIDSMKNLIDSTYLLVPKAAEEIVYG